MLTDGDGATSANYDATVTVATQNDAPALDNSGDLTLPTITEDDADNTGRTVAQILASDSGTPFSDVDGDSSGIAITVRNNGRGIWEYSIDNGSNWDSVGTVSETSALLLRSTDMVRFNPDGNNAPVVDPTFEFRAWDQTTASEGTKVDVSTNGGTTAFSSASETVSITVTNVNDAPVLDNSGAATLDTQVEDAAAPAGVVGTVITDLVADPGNVSDVDASSQTGIAVTNADASDGVWWYTIDNGSNWSLLGDVNDSSARVLNANSSTRIYFQSETDFHGTVTDAITFRAWDRSEGSNGSLQDASTNGGTTAYSASTETADITIVAENDSPQIVGDSIVTNGQFDTDLSGWTPTGNVDHDGTQVRFGQIGGANGTLLQTLTTEVGKTYVVSFDYGDASATKSQSIRVDIDGFSQRLTASIDSSVAATTAQTYQYTFVADSTSTSLLFSDTSADHSGVHSYLDNVSVATDATPNADLAYNENDGAVVIDASVSLADIDDSHIESAVVAITTAYADGEDTLGFSNQNGISGLWNAGTGILTLTGSATVAHYEDALRSVTYENTSDSPDETTRAVSFTVNDGDADSNTQTRGITVQAVNDDPSNAGTLPSDITVVEDVISDVDLSSINLIDADHDGASLTLTFSTSAGGNLTATSAGGVTVSGNNSAALTLNGTLADLNTYINTASNVRYLHGTANTSGDDADTINVVLNDNGNTGTGGGTDQDLGTVNVDITAADDTPTLVNNALTLLENETVTIDNSILSASDVDSSDPALTFNVSNSSGGHFALTSSQQSMITSFTQAQVTAGQVVFVHDGGETAPSYDISVSDGNTSSVAVAASISFTNINDAPLLTALGGDSQSVANDGTVVLVDTGALASLLDADLPANYNGAVLMLNGNSFDALDTVGISTTGSIALSAGISNGSVLSVGGTSVATLSATSNSGMTLSFNPNATASDINTLLRAITFDSTSSTLGLRSIDVNFNDGDGNANGGSDTSPTATVNIALASADDGLVATAEDTTYVFTAGDFDFTGVTGNNLNSVTVTALPSDGSLTLSGAAVSLNQSISKAQIDAGLLRFVPVANDNGTLYTSFDLFVNSGKDTVTVLAGEPGSYTLGGGALPDTDAILADNNNFGPGATVSTNIAVTGTSTTIDAAYLSQGEVFFDGFNADSNWTAGELTALDTWVNAGGILISTNETTGYDPVSSYYGLAIGGDASSTWHVNDASHAIMNGPFALVGNNGSAFSAAGSISYFDSASLAVGDQVIAVDSVSGEPTMVVRQVGNGYILFTSDEGIFRANMTGGGTISTANDILAANVFAWAADHSSVVNTHAMNIDVTAVNDDPSNNGSLPSDISVTEDVSSDVDLSALNLSDIDHEGGDLTVTLATSTGGNLSATSGGGVTVGGNASGSLTLTGTLANLNSFIDTTSNVQYLHSTANTFGNNADTINVDVNDNGNSGSGGGTDQDLGTVNVDITAVNDRPVATGNTVVASEDVPLVIDASDFNYTDIEGDSLVSVTITGLTLNGGTLTHSAGAVTVTNGMTVTAAQLTDLTFTSALNDSTDSSFTYTVNDADAGVSSAVMNITVNAVNDAPVATGNTVTTDEDVPLVIDASDFSFTDVEGDSLVSVTITGLTLNGGTLTRSAGAVSVTNGMTVTAAQLADLTFTSALNDSTNSSFTYTVNDADAGVTSAVMNITVNAVNDVPVATGNTVVANEDVPLVIGPSDFSYTDVEGDALASVTITGLTLNGGTLTHSAGAVTVTNGMTVTAAELADLTFTSALDDSTNSSFTYTVNDADAGITSAVMNITVNAVNDVPVATGNTVTTNEDVPLVIGPSDFSFTDIEGDALASVTITGLALNGGTLTHSAGAVTVTNGMTVTAAQLADLTFTSALNDSTDSSFSYTVNDADAGVASAVMNITVDPVNDAPVATGNTVVASEDVPLVIDASDFSFTDVEGDSLVSVTITGLTLNSGTLTHSAGAVTVTNGMTVTAAQLADLTFTSALNDSTNSSFSYTVNDADAGVTSAVMNITVNPVNDVPVATGNTVVASEDVPLVIDASDFSYTDIEGDSLVSVTITGLTLNGGTLTHSAGAVTVTNGMTVTAAQLADLTFTSALNDSTNSSFTYTVNDADAGVTSSTMNITVNAVNDAPVATGNTVTTDEDVPLVIDASDFSSTDVEGDSLVSVTITGLTLNGGTLTHSAGAVTVTNGMTVTAAQLADLTFTSAPNDSTNSSFTYTVNDADAGVTSAVMNITVNAVNDVPVATGNTVVANEDVPLVIDASDFSFTDVEGDALVSVTITGLTLNGGTLTHSAGAVTVTNGMTVTAAELADLTFTSALNDSTNSSFTYTVNDADAGITSAVMNITVNAVNDAPVATGNTVSTDEDTALVIGISDFNFTDVEGDALSSITVSNLQLNGGTLTHSAGLVTVSNGMQILAAQLLDLTFTPAPNSTLAASFDYRVNDADNGVISATLNITVDPVNDAPVIVSDGGGDNAVLTVVENTTAVTTVMATDIDAGDILAYGINSGDDRSLFSIDPNTGELRFSSAPNYEAAQDHNQDNLYTVQVIASDGNGGFDLQALNITVLNANDRPTDLALSSAAIDEFTNTLGGMSIGQLSAQDEDVADTLSFSVVGGADADVFRLTGVDSSTLIIDDGIINSNQQSAYELVIQATDSAGASTQRAFTITVTEKDIVIPPVEPPVDPEPELPWQIDPPAVTPEESPETPSPSEQGGLLGTGGLSEEPAFIEANLESIAVDELVLIASQLNAQDNDSIKSSMEHGALLPPKQLDLANLELLQINEPPSAALSMIHSEPFVQELQQLADDLDKSYKDEIKKQELITELSTGVTIGLTAGFVSWVLNSGSLLASVLSTMPAWKQIDFAPLLVKSKRREEELSEETEEEKRVAKMFD